MTSHNLAWDYTEAARTYHRRPQYVAGVIAEAVGMTGIGGAGRVADIGAGTGKLTEHFLGRGLRCDCVEPNDAMRANGIAETARFGELVRWSDATAEATGLDAATYGLVSFGSSFNVVDRPAAMAEAARILVPDGWFMCCWNHRDASDPLQQEIEAIILSHIPDYKKGARNEDQSAVIASSGLFAAPAALKGRVMHRVEAGEWVEAWRSHVTLSRQAGDRFGAIVDEIGRAVGDAAFVDIPYVTECWVAERIH